MRQLPSAPSPNERVLAQEYHDSFTGLTTDTVTLTYTPQRTVNGVGLEIVFKNGVLLSGAGGTGATATRESFTGITDPFFTLASHPVVGSELVFRNGQLIDDHAARTANVALAVYNQSVERFTGSTGDITLANAALAGTVLVSKNGAVLDPSSDYTVAGATVTVSGRASGDIIVVHYSYSSVATQTLTVEPAAGTYTIDAAGKITPSVAPVGTDVFTVWYETGGSSGGGSAGYEIVGNVLTLSAPLVASDVIDVYYAYRTN